MTQSQGTRADEVAEHVRAAMGAQDLTVLGSRLADDVRWGSCVGSSQVIEWLQGALAGGLEVAASEVVAHDDRVVLELQVNRPPADETPSTKQRVYQVLFVREGKITEVRDAATHEEALVATPSPILPRPVGPPTNINGMAAVLPVRNLAAALDHYRRLGFAVNTYEGGGYGYAQRDGADFHLSAASNLDPRTTTSAVYLFVDDADALFAEWRNAGVTGQFFEPCDTDYGLREGAHVDRDGNLIRFGSSLGD